MQQFLADDGESISVHVSGEGTPLIFLHGWTANHLEWAMFMRGLNPHYRIYRWDARGHGSHPLHTETPVTVLRMARDLENLLDHFAIERAHIVGHSMGALLLWQYIQDYGTSRINKLCFIDQSPKLVTDENWRMGIYGNFDQQRADAFLAELKLDFAESVLRLIAFGLNDKARTDYLADTPVWQQTRKTFQALQAIPLTECWNSLTAADYRALLPKIDRPTLLLYGGQSNFYTLDTARFVASAIPGSQLLIYEGEDHSPHMWQRERFLGDLRAFLD